MKHIPFTKHGTWDTHSLLLMLLRQAPGGINLGQMRERLALLKTIETSKVAAVVEDKDHKFLCALLEAFPGFAVVDENAVLIADGILQAGDAPAPMLVPEASAA
jgi:hypothetical protein